MEDHSAWGLIGAVIGGVITALSIAVTNFLKTWSQTRIDEKKADTQGKIDEDVNAAGLLQKQVDDLRAENKDLRNQLNQDRDECQKALDKLREESQAKYEANRKEWHERTEKFQEKFAELYRGKAAMEVEIAKKEGEVKLLQTLIQRIQEKTGILPAAPRKGSIAIDKAGLVVMFSENLTTFLGWTQRDVVGKMGIASFMRPIDAEKHACKFEAAMKGEIPIDPSHPINTYFLAKDGRPIAVSVAPDGTFFAKLGFVSATISEREEVKPMTGDR